MSRIDDVRETLDEIRQGRAWRLLRKPLAAVGVLVALVIVEWFLVGWLGIVDALAYSIMFVVGVALVPFLIALAGELLVWNTAIGRMHILIGAVAFNHHYLVDMGDRWEWCPGDDDRVYVDGEWHDIEGGFANRSILGWRPFGILRFKEDDTFGEIRADTAAERERGHSGASTDGGAVNITRGGYDQVDPPIESGTDGTWIVDLKRLFARGVRKFGDTELIETAEEVIERGEVTPSTFEGWRPIIGVFGGLILGSFMGYVLFFG